MTLGERFDRPSVYVGGNGGGHEVDCGLTWDRVYDERGRATFTDSPAGNDGRDPARRFVITSEAPLVLVGERLEAKGSFKVAAGSRVLAEVALNGKPAVAARFTLK